MCFCTLERSTLLALVQIAKETYRYATRSLRTRRHRLALNKCSTFKKTLEKLQLASQSNRRDIFRRTVHVFDRPLPSAHFRPVQLPQEHMDKNPRTSQAQRRLGQRGVRKARAIQPSTSLTATPRNHVKRSSLCFHVATRSRMHQNGLPAIELIPSTAVRTRPHALVLDFPARTLRLSEKQSPFKRMVRVRCVSIACVDETAVMIQRWLVVPSTPR